MDQKINAKGLLKIMKICPANAKKNCNPTHLNSHSFTPFHVLIAHSYIIPENKAGSLAFGCKRAFWYNASISSLFQTSSFFDFEIFFKFD